MGVPALFRWLSNKYPKIISPVIEDDSLFDGPNPNGELDNLYLDMNGIVHPCSHPENKPPPANESQMMLEIFKYTDRLIRMARPRKILMIAIDGVAPRAKMNQQRSRRFRSARDARLKNQEMEIEMKLKQQQDILNGKIIDDSVKSGHTQWDSNAITPGTPFMDILAKSVRYWVAYKLAHDENWENLQVVISDSSVPGEGEHKIMNFIRSQRSNPQYNPNTTHSIYGLDADLIFLGLATHEPHFRILREDVFAKFGNGPSNRNLSVKENMNLSEEEKKRLNKSDDQKPFLWLNTHILREYLKVELLSGVNIPQLNKNLDFERCLDDWIFLCFFIGNDFLPNLPSLNVRDNSIDLLVNIWKNNLPYIFNNKKSFNNDHYLTRDGTLNMPAVEVLLKSLGSMEDGILRKKHSNEVRQAEFEKRRKVMREQNKGNTFTGSRLNEHKVFVNEAAEINKVMPIYSVDNNKVVNNVTKTSKEIISNPVFVNKQPLAKDEPQAKPEDIDAANKQSQSAAAAIKANLLANLKKRKLDDTDTPSESEVSVKSVKVENSIKEPTTAATDADGADDEYDPEGIETTATEDEDVPNTITNSQTGQVIDNNDIIRMWEPGYSARYYKLKFNLQSDDQILPFKKKLLVHYLEGISWVLLYYYQGCPSWNWYYPYHYAPFASDFSALNFKKEVNIKFVQGKPFRPFEQLMSVLPADSSHNLPDVFHDLMKNPDSGIIEYYPEYFDIDMNGSKMSWHGIPLLPFINEKKLLKHVEAKYDLLSDAEKFRNKNKEEILLISSKNKWFKIWKKELFEENEEGEAKRIAFSAKKTNLSGIVSISKEYNVDGVFEFPLNENKEDDPYPATISNSLYLTVGYDFYSPVSGKVNKSMILNGFVYPLEVLNQEDKNAIIYGGQGFAVRQKKSFNHSQNDNINFALTIGPLKQVDGEGKLKRQTNIYKPRYGGYLNQIKSQQQQQQQHAALNAGGLGMYADLLNTINAAAASGGNVGGPGGQYNNNHNNNTGNYSNNYNNDNNYNNNGYNNNYQNNNNNYNNYHHNNRYNGGDSYTPTYNNNNYYNGNRGGRGGRGGGFGGNRGGRGGYRNNRGGFYQNNSRSFR